MNKAQREWAIIERMMVGDFDPEQPRDERGRWTDIGQFICKIDLNIYKCINPEIDTDEVIMTNRKSEHAEESHDKDFEQIREHIPDTLKDPDIIFKGNKPNTGIVVKQISEEGRRVHVIIKVHVPADGEGVNTVRSAWKIGNATYKRLKKHGIILYEKQ